MSDKLVGVVAKVSEQTGNGRRGPWRKIGLNINDEWYGGFVGSVNGSLEEVKEGDKVAIDYMVSGQYKNLVSVDIVEKATSTSAAAAATGGNDFQAQRTWGFIVGASLNQAVDVVDSMVKNDVITLPAKAKRYEAYMGYIAQVAKELSYLSYDMQSTLPEDEEPEVDFDDPAEIE